MGVRRLFGYIRPLEAQLRVCELEEYRAVYLPEDSMAGIADEVYRYYNRLQKREVYD